MKKTQVNAKKNITKTAIAMAFAATLSTASVYACDSCTELATISDSTAQIAENTSFLGTITSSMQGGLALTTNALFGSLESLPDTTAEFTAIPDLQKGAYVIQNDMLNTIETDFRGTTGEGNTEKNNFDTIFGKDYFLHDDSDDDPSFSNTNASAASLFLNPGEAGFYTDDQKKAAEVYIKLLSGVALSTQRAPDKGWLLHGNDKERTFTRSVIGQYYTFSAMQSAVANNLAYVYSLNTGQAISDDLGTYEGTTVSESGLLKHIQLDKVENEEWYSSLGTMAISAILQEQTILIAGAFLELTRIEELLKRQLVTESASTTNSLLLSQALVKKMNQMNDPNK